MLYLIDTKPWKESEVSDQCVKYGIEFKTGFYYPMTCVKLASHIMKDYIASEYGISLSSLEYSSHGKPYFPENKVYFNLSHHDRIVIAITSTTQEVGIDLSDRELPFSDDEYTQLFSELPPPSLRGHFWAAREAFLKFTGEGTREGPLKINKPAHESLPDLEHLGPLAVMPFIKVESQFARLFKVKNYVGAVIAPRADITEVCVFSSEIEDS